MPGASDRPHWNLLLLLKVAFENGTTHELRVPARLRPF